MISRSVVLLIIASLPTWCSSLPVQPGPVQCWNHLRLEPGRPGWQGTLTVRTEDDYSGIWVEMCFDRKLDSFSSSYGNVSRLNSTSFSILDVNGQVLRRVPFEVAFLMTCDACAHPPLLKNLIINGKTLCINTEIRERQTTALINKTNEINVDIKLKNFNQTDTTNKTVDLNDIETKNETIELGKIAFKDETINKILPEIKKVKTNKYQSSIQSEVKNTANSNYSSQNDSSNDTMIITEVLNNNTGVIVEKTNKEFKSIINTSKLNTNKTNLLNVAAKEDSVNKVVSGKPGINKSKIELRKLDECIMEKLLETKVDTDILKELADVESYYSVRNLEKALFKHHVYEKMSTSPDYVKMMN